MNPPVTIVVDRGKGDPISLGAALATGKKVGPDAINLLMQDHMEALAMFDWAARADTPERKLFVVRNLCAALTAHMQVEEEIFYPAAAEGTGDRDLIRHSVEEHDKAKAIISKLKGRGTIDEEFASLLDQLRAAITEHVNEEETKLFPEVRGTDLDLFQIGAEVAARRVELLLELTGHAPHDDTLKETHMTPVSPDAVRPLFVEGLKNIHAIQKNAKAMMERAIDRLEHYPDVKARLQAHLTDKDNEMARAEQILESMGESASGLKDSAMAMMGNMSAMMTAPAGDEILKDSFATFGLANMEIAAYEALLEMGQAAGQTDAVRLLQQSLAEERAMAAWLQDNLRGAVRMHMQLRSEGRTAKH